MTVLDPLRHRVVALRDRARLFAHPLRRGAGRSVFRGFRARSTRRNSFRTSRCSRSARSRFRSVFFTLGQLVSWLILVQILVQFVWQCAGVILLRRTADMSSRSGCGSSPPRRRALAMWIYVFVSAETQGIAFTVAFFVVGVVAYFVLGERGRSRRRDGLAAEDDVHLRGGVRLQLLARVTEQLDALLIVLEVPSLALGRVTRNRLGGSRVMIATLTFSRSLVEVVAGRSKVQSVASRVIRSSAAPSSFSSCAVLTEKKHVLFAAQVADRAVPPASATLETTSGRASFPFAPSTTPMTNVRIFSGASIPAFAAADTSVPSLAFGSAVVSQDVGAPSVRGRST